MIRQEVGRLIIGRRSIEIMKIDKEERWADMMNKRIEWQKVWDHTRQEIENVDRVATTSRKWGKKRLNTHTKKR